MKATHPFVAAFLAAAVWVSSPNNHGRILDDFNDNVKTDWTDFNFGVGGSTETGGQFKFDVPAMGQALFAASTKTSQQFSIQDGRTIEFRVDLVSGNSKDSFAVMGFVPASKSISGLNGYFLAKSPTDILIVKGINRYFFEESPEPAVKNDNVTLVLRLTGDGPNVIINARVLDKDNNNSVIFDQTFVDTPAADIMARGDDSPATPYMEPGYFALLEYADFEAGGPSVYEVIYDNAESFEFENILVDDFNDNTKTGWTDFRFGDGLGGASEVGGQFKFGVPNYGQALFAASTKASPIFSLQDGEVFELSVDLVSGNSKDSFAVVGWVPTSGQVSALNGYFIAKSPTDILVVKGINRYFFNENPTPAIKNDNVTLAVRLEGRNGNVIITTRVLDKDANNAVLFEKTFIDTPAVDILAEGEDSPAAPFSGTGNFVLLDYADAEAGGPSVYEVIYDNARAAVPLVKANTAPIAVDFRPGENSNFLPAATEISLRITDDKPLADDDIVLVLNDAPVTGATLSGPATNRTVAFSGLKPDVNYVLHVGVTDSDNVETASDFYFDTFSTNHLVIEAEDFNFDGGAFVDNPVPVSETAFPLPDNSYYLRMGAEGYDYHDTRTSPYNQAYRPQDTVRTRHSLDLLRGKFIEAGGSANNVYDYDVGDIEPAEWINYTRTFLPGSYEVYLRESLFNVDQSETVLELVTSGGATTEQTTRVLGSFLGRSSGALFRNVALTDAIGQNKVVLQLSGQTTLRLTQRTGDTDDGALYQNYFVFVPAAVSGVQRATVAAVTPAPGTTVETFEPVVVVIIQNRETTVDTNSIVLKIGGTAVSPIVAGTEEGAVVTAPVAPLPAAGSTVSAQIEFKDSDGVSQTNQWSFVITYRAVDPALRVAGTGTDSGFSVLTVQAPQGSNLADNLQRAEDQLTAGSTVPAYYRTNTTSAVVNFSQDAGGGHIGNNILIPGLDVEMNGSDDIAMEITAYVDLPAGRIRFGIASDDGYKLAVGSLLNVASAKVLSFRNGGTADHAYDVLVPVAGLYPFRLVWYERSGGAHIEWTSIDPDTAVRTLINDPDSPNSIKAYRSVTAPEVLVESATVVNGQFTADASAQVNTTQKTITTAASGQTRFYRVRATPPANQEVVISDIDIANGVVTLQYSFRAKP